MTQAIIGISLWFAATVLSVLFVVLDLSKTRPAESTLRDKIQRLGWILNALYMGPFCALVYRAVRTGPHSDGPIPLWKRAAASTMHCAPGPVTGMLLAALISNGLGISRGWELVAEYFGGLVLGLLVFKAPAVRASFSGRYWGAVDGNWLSEVLTMNTMMAGQIPMMAILMRLDERAMQPGSVFFWATMSFSFIVGSLTTYPLMLWLLSTSGQGDHGRLAWPKLSTMMTIAALAVGVGAAYSYGYFEVMGPMARHA